MLQKLIVNADDFGLTEGSTLGIIRSHEDGIVTSTTMMVNMPFCELACQLAKAHPDLGVGCHLVLTIGRPLVEGAKSYTDENGNFRRPATYPTGKPHADLDELYREWKAQIERFIALMGRKPTHLDSHHHVHLVEHHLPVVFQLAKEYDIPVRLGMDTPLKDYPFEVARAVRNFYEDSADPVYFLEDRGALLEQDGICELMCHPAIVDQRLRDISSYALPRTKEMATLRDPRVASWLKAHGIELVNFSTLKHQ